MPAPAVPDKPRPEETLSSKSSGFQGQIDSKEEGDQFSLRLLGTYVG